MEPTDLDTSPHPPDEPARPTQPRPRKQPTWRALLPFITVGAIVGVIALVALVALIVQLVQTTSVTVILDGEAFQREARADTVGDRPRRRGDGRDHDAHRRGARHRPHAPVATVEHRAGDDRGRSRASPRPSRRGGAPRNRAGPRRGHAPSSAPGPFESDARAITEEGRRPPRLDEARVGPREPRARLPSLAGSVHDLRGTHPQGAEGESRHCRKQRARCRRG